MRLRVYSFAAREQWRFHLRRRDFQPKCFAQYPNIVSGGRRGRGARSTCLLVALR